MKSPQTSIVIPTYNRLEHVQIAIDSILEQTYRDYEIIVIDDGSTDGTKDVLPQKYAGKIIYHYQENHGRSAARNFGASLAKGEYLAFLDSDDKWSPAKLEEQIRYMEQDVSKSLALVCCNVLKIDIEGNLISNQVVDKYSEAARYNLERFFYSPVIFASPSNILLRKFCFDKVGGFDHQLEYGEDWDLLIRLKARWKFGYIDKPLVFYRCRHNLREDFPEIDKIDFQMEQNLTVLRKSYALLSGQAASRVKQKMETELYERSAFQYFGRDQWEAGLERLLKAATYEKRCIDDKTRVVYNIGLWGAISGISLFGNQGEQIEEYFSTRFLPKITEAWPSRVAKDKTFHKRASGAFYHNLAAQINLDHKTASHYAIMALQFNPLRYSRSPGNWSLILKGSWRYA